MHAVLQYLFLLVPLVLAINTTNRTSSLRKSNDTETKVGCMHYQNSSLIIEAENYSRAKDTEMVNMYTKQIDSIDGVDLKNNVAFSNQWAIGYTKPGEYVEYDIQFKLSGTYIIQLFYGLGRLKISRVNLYLNGEMIIEKMELENTTSDLVVGNVSSIPIYVKTSDQKLSFRIEWIDGKIDFDMFHFNYIDNGVSLSDGSLDAILRPTFEKFDVNSDQQLTVNDFSKLLESAGKKLSNDDIISIIHKIDPIGYEIIDYGGFRKWIMADLSSNRVEQQLRDELCAAQNYFWGFTYYEWAQFNELDDDKIMNWTPDDVALYLCHHQALRVVRKYLTRESLNEVDGETLLEMTADDWVSLGVKRMHTKKLVRITANLQGSNDDTDSVHRLSTIAEYSDGLISPTSPKGYFNQPSFGIHDPQHIAVSHFQKKMKGDEESRILHWKKGEIIGSGTCGQVFIGLDEIRGAMIALKEVKVDDTTNDIKLLQEEIKLLKMLKHDNIVRYLDTQYLKDEGLFYIFTEWVPGGSLETVLQQFGSLAEAVIKKYTWQVLCGLNFLHSNNVIHMDIKGANILVDDRGTIKLADFGSSQKIVLHNKRGPQKGAPKLAGTPFFMAPEVILQLGHGKEADIWSVGATVYQMVTGQPPWKSMGFDNFLSLMRHISTTKQPPKLPATISPVLRSFLLSCFQRDPKKRLSAEALLKHPFITGGQCMSIYNVNFVSSYSDRSAEELRVLWNKDQYESNDGDKGKVKNDCAVLGLKDHDIHLQQQQLDLGELSLASDETLIYLDEGNPKLHQLLMRRIELMNDFSQEEVNRLLHDWSQHVFTSTQSIESRSTSSSASSVNKISTNPISRMNSSSSTASSISTGDNTDNNIYGSSINNSNNSPVIQHYGSTVMSGSGSSYPYGISNSNSNSNANSNNNMRSSFRPSRQSRMSTNTGVELMRRRVSTSRTRSAMMMGGSSNGFSSGIDMMGYRRPSMMEEMTVEDIKIATFLKHKAKLTRTRTMKSMNRTSSNLSNVATNNNINNNNNNHVNNNIVGIIGNQTLSARGGGKGLVHPAALGKSGGRSAAKKNTLNSSIVLGENKLSNYNSSLMKKTQRNLFLHSNSYQLLDIPSIESSLENTLDVSSALKLSTDPTPIRSVPHNTTASNKKGPSTSTTYNTATSTHKNKFHRVDPEIKESILNKEKVLNKDVTNTKSTPEISSQNDNEREKSDTDHNNTTSSSSSNSTNKKGNSDNTSMGNNNENNIASTNNDQEDHVDEDQGACSTDDTTVTTSTTGSSINDKIPLKICSTPMPSEGNNTAFERITTIRKRSNNPFAKNSSKPWGDSLTSRQTTAIQYSNIVTEKKTTAMRRKLKELQAAVVGNRNENDMIMAEVEVSPENKRSDATTLEERESYCEDEGGESGINFET